MTLDGCHSILFGLIANLREFIERFPSHVSSDSLRRILSITTLLIKRATTQTDLFKLISINLFDLMARSLKALPTAVLRERNIVTSVNVDEYLNYFVNRNILTFFDKEKAVELEKQSTFNATEIFTSINANIKANNLDVLQIRYNIIPNSLFASSPSMLFTKEVIDPSHPLL